MNSHSTSKINYLVTNARKGGVLTAAYLRRMGFSYELLRRYEKSGWLDSLGYGAFKLHGVTVDWMGGLWAIQTQAKKKVHVGGKTALELKGFAHYVKQRQTKVFLFGPEKETLPLWFRRHNWGLVLKFSPVKLFAFSTDEGFSEYQKGELSIRISSPERAAMEMLYHVPREQTFEEALLIMENLTSLRPSLVQKLLEACNSIKVKRLFLYSAEKHAYPWVKRLDLTKVSLGSGKRVIAEGGVLDKKYQITVPREAGQ
jgi:hypothetical protein